MCQNGVRWSFIVIIKLSRYMFPTNRTIILIHLLVAVQDNIITRLFGSAYPEVQDIMSIVSTSRSSSCHAFFIQSTIFITMPRFPGGYQQQAFHSW